MAGREALTRPLVTGGGKRGPQDGSGPQRVDSASCGRGGPRRPVSWGQFSRDQPASEGFSVGGNLHHGHAMSSVGGVCLRSVAHEDRCHRAAGLPQSMAGRGAGPSGGVMGRGMRGAPRHEAGHRLLGKCTDCFATLPHRVQGQGRNAQKPTEGEQVDMKIRCSTHASSA